MWKVLMREAMRNHVTTSAVEASVSSRNSYRSLNKLVLSGRPDICLLRIEYRIQNGPDSDSDDLFLSAPTFKVTKVSRAQDKNRANEIKMLTSMLKDSGR
jgi:hypothetical protein